MTLFLVATLFAATAAADTSCSSSDVTELLQSHTAKGLVIDKSNQGALQEMAEVLAKAKRSCRVTQSPDCLGNLKDLRTRLWPYVMGELAETDAQLDLQPNQILEEHVPRSDIYRAALKPELCEKEYKPLYFADLTEGQNQGMIRDLDMVSRENLRLLPRDAKATNCEELIPQSERKFDHEATFVLLQDPLNRFIQGYVAIEQSLEKGSEAGAGQNYQFLQQSKGNLTARVTTFLNHFFRDGANHSRHVASMAEYVGKLNNYCQKLPLKYFAHVERTKKGWIEFLHHMGCSQVMRELTAFDAVLIKGNFTRTMEDAMDQQAPPFVAADEQMWDEEAKKGQDVKEVKIEGGKVMEVKNEGEKERIIAEVKRDDNKEPPKEVQPGNMEAANKAQLLQVSAASSARSAEMSRVMGLNNYVYLRAFCWFALPDYVLFEYDLPEACHREDMNVILKLTEEKLIAIREAAQMAREALQPKEEKKPEEQKQKDELQDGQDEDMWDRLDEGLERFDQ